MSAAATTSRSDGTFVGVRQQYCLGASSWPAWYAIYPSSNAVHAGIPSATNAHYVSSELPTARSLSGYSIGVRVCNSHDNPNHPSTWEMQGSNDYSSWTALDSQTSLRFTTDSTAAVASTNCYSEGGASNTRQFNLSSPGTAFKYYRFYVTANGRAAYSDATWDAYTIWDRMTLSLCESTYSGSSSCTANTCTCISGTAATGASCTSDGAAICSGCSASYHLSGTSCEANTCTCSSGTAATGTACTTNGGSICTGCSAGYYLSGTSCAANTCSCSTGTAATGTACTTNGASICSGCSAGYHLGGSCSSPSALPGSPR
jgi:hypothetical protein